MIPCKINSQRRRHHERGLQSVGCWRGCVGHWGFVCRDILSSEYLLALPRGIRCITNLWLPDFGHESRTKHGPLAGYWFKFLSPLSLLMDTEAAKTQCIDGSVDWAKNIIFARLINNMFDATVTECLGCGVEFGSSPLGRFGVHNSPRKIPTAVEGD
jgi:hypothetical protein